MVLSFVHRDHYKYCNIISFTRHSRELPSNIIRRRTTARTKAAAAEPVGQLPVERMPDDKAAPLVARQTISFYDFDCMLGISSSVANGYVILLTGGKAAGPALDTEGRVKKSETCRESENSLLGFLALTEGNVVDACFGVHAVAIKKSSAMQQVNKVKSLLLAASDDNNDIRQLAVETYRGAFEILLQYQGKLRKLNFFTRCFRYRGLVRDTSTNLQRAFEELSDALQSSTGL